MAAPKTQPLPLEFKDSAAKRTRRPAIRGGGGVLCREEVPESAIQGQILALLHSRRWLAIRVNSGGMKKGKAFIWFYKIFGLAPRYASSGFPDIVAFKHSRFLLIEVKDFAGQLNENQERFKRWAEAFGVKIHTCRSQEDALQLTEAYTVHVQRTRTIEAAAGEVYELLNTWRESPPASKQQLIATIDEFKIDRLRGA